MFSVTGLRATDIPKASATLISKPAFVGDPVVLQIEIVADEKNPPNWPEKPTLPPEFYLYKQSPQNIFPFENKLKIFSISYTLVPLDSGTFVVPPIKISLQGKGALTVQTDSIWIPVNKVPLSADEKAMQPLPPLKVYEGLPIMPIVFIGIAILLLILAIIIRWWIKYRKPQNIIPQGSDPYQWSVVELQALMPLIPWNDVAIVHRMHDILRSYLARSIPEAGLQYTSSELILVLSKQTFPDLHRLESWLKDIDSIRFASFKAQASQQQILVEEALKILLLVQQNYKGGKNG